MSAASSPAAVTPVTPEIARRVADAWVRAWNDHSLEAILSHYAPEVVFTSPLVVKRMARADGTLRGLDELREYFAAGLKQQPALRFELDDVLTGVDSVALAYRNHRGQRVVEVMHLNGRGQVLRAVVNYAG